MKKPAFLFQPVRKKECMEFGHAAILISLLFALKLGTRGVLELTLALTLFTIIAPIVFFPFAYVWFCFARILAVIMPAVILSLIFFIVLIPTALLRRLMGHDRLKLKEIRRSPESVFLLRNHLFTIEDQEHTF